MNTINYFRNYLGKDIDTLTYDDIESYFQLPNIETNTIEFKSFNVNEPYNKALETLKVTISSFLNSDGGIVIWGAPKGIKNKNTNEKEFTGALAPIPNIGGHDRLYSSIIDSITPLPTGIRQRIITKESENPESDNISIVLFEIQKSNYSPHRACNQYHIRLDGQKKIAPHYLLDALFKRITYPQLECKVEGFKSTNSILTFNYSFQVEIHNTSPMINEFNTKVYVLFDDRQKKKIIQSEALHLGDPIVIPFNKSDNVRSRSIDISIIFGGDKSPLKYSTYVINLETENYIRSSGNSASQSIRDISTITKIVSNQYLDSNLKL